MEVFVFGLTALLALNNKQERIVPEPAEFQSFDLRTLGHLHDARENSASRTSDRKRGPDRVLTVEPMYYRYKQHLRQLGRKRASKNSGAFITEHKI
jgi:hypothetical protein